MDGEKNKWPNPFNCPLKFFCFFFVSAIECCFLWKDKLYLTNGVRTWKMCTRLKSYLSSQLLQHDWMSPNHKTAILPLCRSGRFFLWRFSRRTEIYLLRRLSPWFRLWFIQRDSVTSQQPVPRLTAMVSTCVNLKVHFCPPVYMHIGKTENSKNSWNITEKLLHLAEVEKLVYR